MKSIYSLGLLLLAMAFSGCSSRKEAVEKSPTRVKTEVVTTASAGMGDRKYVGIVEESKGTAVSFTGMGVVRRMLVEEGQAVAKGQLIAEMDDTQARNVLAGAEAQMAQAEDALKRYGLLHENGSLPEVQWVEVQSKVAQARSQLAVAKKNLADCRLVAPVGGVVGRRHVVAGETALPSQAVVTILDISSVKVKVSIPEAEMKAITAHTPTHIRVEAINETFAGGRIEKGVQADALTHTYDIRIHVANAGRRLLPGMVASVEMAVGGSGQAAGVTVPLASVQKKVDGTLFVWTVDNNRTAHRTSVDIGRTLGNRVTIAGGLSAGSRVVVEGYQKLSEGSRVVY